MNLTTDINDNPFQITLTLTPEPAPEVRLLLEAALTINNATSKATIAAAKKLILSNSQYEKLDKNETIDDNSIKIQLLHSDDLPFSAVCEKGSNILSDFCDKNPTLSIRSFIDHDEKNVLLIFMGQNITISYVRILASRAVYEAK